jgi:hypothetical protein
VRSPAWEMLSLAVVVPMDLRAEAKSLDWLATASSVLLLILAVCWMSAVGGLLYATVSGRKQRTVPHGGRRLPQHRLRPDLHRAAVVTQHRT